MNLRQWLYRAASILGDVNAVKKGKVVQRVVRKRATKGFSSILNKVLRW